MSKPARAAAAILIASDSVTDAALVKELLDQEFDQVFTSTDANRVVEDFESRRPDILVLAFDALEKAERYYLGLYRLCPSVNQHPHRTVILCGKDEVKRVYELCRKEYFDDYVLFWPMAHDTLRLPMSVHHALRELGILKAGGPSAAEFATQARRLRELEAMLDQQMTQGGQHAEAASRAMEQTELEIGAVLDGFSRRLAQRGLQDVVSITNVEGLEREIARLKREEIQQHFRKASESVQPLKQWMGEFRQECVPHLESARALNAMADRIRPIVLVVDDDEFQRKLVGKMLEAENFRVALAASGIEALGILRKMRPDLILMDVMMAHMDGMETTRRLKSVPQLADVPVIMITGKSEGNIVIDSLKAGAVDFVVKPVDRTALIGKISRALSTTHAPKS